MLQEATKIINLAFKDSFIKRLCLYLHDCVREEVQSSTFRNLKQDKENKWIFLETENKYNVENSSVLDNEKLFTSYPQPLKLDGSDSYLTELMLLGENSKKDKYLIYGYLFLVGKNAKTKRKNEFLTPLLYSACKLERTGMNIECSLQEEGLSLNTAALTSLMNLSGEEDEIDNMLDGLLETVPKLPLKEEDLNIFLTTLKSLIPDLEFELNEEEQLEDNIKDNSSDFYEERQITYENLQEALEEAETEKPKPKLKADRVILTNKSAVILTKRPLVTAGVLYELTQIAEKPSGTIRETSLNIVNEEYMQGKGKMASKPIKENNLKDFAAITPLSLSDSQEDVIKNLEDNTILSVYGPPGTGKSQTIVNLICHLVSNGKTVLVASRMDKATDVIADRLNDFGAPYLALRAGRPNYQKQLSFDLQDLISNKVDLDTDFENSILVDVDDMQKLIMSVRDKENKCEEIIKLEEQWQKIIKERDEKENYAGKMQFLTEKLSMQEVEDIENAIKNIEQNDKKLGVIADLALKYAAYKLKNIIKNKNFKPDFENLERIKLELEIAKLSAKARYIETQILKTGNIHSLLEEIKLLKRKQKTLAVEILKGKRRNSLKGLLRDQVKRQRLIVHTKALVTRKKNLQNRLLEDEDFNPLLEAFPCWCVTTYAVSNSLPLKPGLFDVAIIDEASQCDIAGCIPVLYRCKKAVIVGDDKQLPHLSFLEKSKEQSFLSQYEIPDKYQLMWKFRTNSMFDLANYYSSKPVLLDEHFRSYAPVIDFSNNEFYGGRIRVMSQCNDNNVLELVQVKEGKVDSDITRNMPEVEAIMHRLQEIIQEDEKIQDENHKPVTVGIISPFRGQVELIKKALLQLYPESVLKKHNIETGTAHTFQGDERDIIMLSWAVANNSFNQSLTFLQIPNLFNVAITRARKKQIIFLSKEPKSLPQGLLKDYIEYVREYIQRNTEKEELNTDRNIYKNSFEKEIAAALKEEGFYVEAGNITAGLSADLTVKNHEGKTLIIECDGMADNVKSGKPQIKKQTLMERTGAVVERISFREWYISQQGCIERIKNIFLNV
ncbi:MAG: AAA domain-containing protein [Candidatus Gastranaerophilales bacterium]|nr:AAA domain-containing protein [Candidatus Gastranaerophilales bacterium]